MIYAIAYVGLPSCHLYGKPPIVISLHETRSFSVSNYLVNNSYQSAQSINSTINLIRVKAMAVFRSRYFARFIHYV